VYDSEEMDALLKRENRLIRLNLGLSILILGATAIARAS
jgi:hypothetical protein